MAVAEAGTIDFNKAFGTSAKPAAKSDRPAAKYWINVGYYADVPSGKDDGELEKRFISLPMGIPVDTMDDLKTNSRNVLFAQFQGARNNLKEQILAAAQNLEPGQECVLNLKIQLRHVNEELEDVSAENNTMIQQAPTSLVL